MPIANYGVLKGRPFERILATSKSEHYQILINRGSDPHRIAINSKSSEAPSQVLFYAVDDFHHSITDAITDAGLDDGFTALVSQPGGIALDFIRGNLFDVEELVPIPSNVPGADNDLNDRIDFFVQQAISDPSAVIYAFGQHWVDDNKPDEYFPEINPSTGIHDIHMNQGNMHGKYIKDNGIYQDGGLIFHYSSRNKWSAVFTAFQSQSFHTDDKTGKALDGIPAPIIKPKNEKPTSDQPKTTEPAHLNNQPEFTTNVRIIAAMVNPGGDDTGREYVILLNKGTSAIDLTGWQIADRLKHKDTISNQTIKPGDTLRINLSGKGAQLSNKGGNISLLNNKGVKIDGVSYTKADASREGNVIEL